MLVKEYQVMRIVNEVMCRKGDVVIPQGCSFDTVEMLFSNMGVTYEPVYAGLDLSGVLEEITNKDCKDKWYALVEDDSCFDKHELVIVEKIKEACKAKGVTLVYSK